MYKITSESIDMYNTLKEGILIKRKKDNKVLFFNSSYNFTNEVIKEIPADYNGEEVILGIYKTTNILDYAKRFEDDLKELKKDGLIVIKVFTESYSLSELLTNFSYIKNLKSEIERIISLFDKRVVNYHLDRQFVESYMLYDGTIDEAVKDIGIFIKQITDKFPEARSRVRFSVYQIESYMESFDSIDAKLNFAVDYSSSYNFNNIFIYDKKIVENIQLAQELIENFNSAIENNEFKLYVQPTYDMNKQSIIGGEILSRWVYKGETLQPEKYIPILEESGLIANLDRYTIQETLKSIRIWLDEGLKVVPISFNLSRFNFEDPNLFDDFLSMVDSYKVPHNLIQPEITETFYNSNQEKIESFINKCREYGFSVLLDDFGSGSSSLVSLKDLNVTGIKFDYNKIKKAKLGQRVENILESAIFLAQSLDMSIVITGIENETDFSLMSQLKVPFVQGFYLSKPLDLLSFSRLTKIDTVYSKSFDIKLQNLDDIMIPETPSNLMFESSIARVGLFRLNNDKLTPFFVNNEFRLSLPLYLNNIRKINIFDYIHPDDVDRIKQYFYDLVDGKEIDDYITYRLIGNTIHRTERSKVIHLKKYNNENIFYIQAITLFDFDSEQTLRFEDFDVLFSNIKDLSIIAVDNIGVVRYANTNMREMIPNIRLGYKTPIVSSNGSTVYDLMLKGKEMLYFEYQNAYVKSDVVDYKSNFGMLKIGFFIKDKDLCSLRDSSSFINNINSLSAITDIYTEINLTDNSFTQLRFGKDHLDKYKQSGDYMEALRTYASAVDVTDRDKVEMFLDKEFLLATLRKNSNFKFNYKLSDGKTWYGNALTYYKDAEDKEFCVAFTWDATEDIKKELNGLTGVYNREFGIRNINLYITDNPNTNFAFAILDFDNFKVINDTYGHPVGDSILETFGKILNSYNSVEMPVKLRLGGDEFIVLLSNVISYKDASAIVDKLLVKFKEEVLKEKNIVADFTYGIARYPSDGRSFDTLYRDADKKLYENKKIKKVKR